MAEGGRSGMLVRVQPGAGAGVEGLSSAESRVRDLFAGWAAGTEFHIPGLAVFNVYLPEKKTTRQVDGLLFLPSGLVVLEVKGFIRKQSGRLRIPMNGTWRVGEEPAALHTLASAPNPGDQVRNGVFAAKAAFADVSGDDEYVRGLVVLASAGRLDIPQQKDAAGRGIDVALATRRSLRGVMHRYGRRPQRWTADGVRAACGAVDLSEFVPDREELLADGFPEHLPPSQPVAPTTTGPQPALQKPVVPSRSFSPSSTGGGNLRSRSTRTATASGTTRSSLNTAGERPPVPVESPIPKPPSRPASAPVSATRPHAAAPPRRVPWGLIVLLVVLAAIGITAAILVNNLFHG